MELRIPRKPKPTPEEIERQRIQQEELARQRRIQQEIEEQRRRLQATKAILLANRSLNATAYAAMPFDQMGTIGHWVAGDITRELADRNIAIVLNQRDSGYIFEIWANGRQEAHITIHRVSPEQAHSAAGAFHVRDHAGVDDQGNLIISGTARALIRTQPDEYGNLLLQYIFNEPMGTVRPQTMDVARLIFNKLIDYINNLISPTYVPPQIQGGKRKVTRRKARKSRKTRKH